MAEDKGSPPIQHDIEDREPGLRLELVRGWKQLDGEPAAGGGRYALQEPVLFVLRFARKIHLRDQHIDRAAYLEVDMRRTDEPGRGGIRAGLDRLEVVASLGIRSQHREALEIRIERRRIRVARMRVAAGGVRLPYFQLGAAHGLALHVEHAAHDIEDLSRGASRLAREMGEI